MIDYIGMGALRTRILETMQVELLKFETQLLYGCNYYYGNKTEHLFLSKVGKHARTLLCAETQKILQKVGIQISNENY